jgi:hypothetical protein
VSDAKSLDEIDFAEALGQTATFYMFTRGVSSDLNRGAAFILILVHTIVQFPPTSVEGDTTIWGPWTEALNPSEYRLTVRPDDDGSYLWSLEGRLKAEGGEFRAVLAGDALPGDTKGQGSGDFMIDFDVAEELDPAGNDGVGQLAVTYDLSKDPAQVVMDYETLAPTPEGIDQPATFHYEYREARDMSGDFVFNINADLDDNGSAWEYASVRSRWQADGAGRSDVEITGGDMGSLLVTASECWDRSFGRIYYNDSVEWQPTEGDPAACAFSDVSLPSD